MIRKNLKQRFLTLGLAKENISVVNVNMPSAVGKM